MKLVLSLCGRTSTTKLRPYTELAKASLLGCGHNTGYMKKVDMSLDEGRENVTLFRRGEEKRGLPVKGGVDEGQHDKNEATMTEQG
ncbi:hypothetical protein V6N13_083149 [Hibiscus sabdariffa]